MYTLHSLNIEQVRLSLEDGFVCLQVFFGHLQSGASSLAKHGGAYFSAVYGSIQDPIAAPGLFDIQVP